MHLCIDSPGLHRFNGIPWYGNRNRINLSDAMPPVATEDALWEELIGVKIRAIHSQPSQVFGIPVYVALEQISHAAGWITKREAHRSRTGQ